MTTTTVAACPFDWCIYDHPGHHEHAWTDGVPAMVAGKLGHVYTYASVYEGDEFDDGVLIGSQRDDDECSGSEGWLSIEDAEYLRDALTQAIKYAQREQSGAGAGVDDGTRETGLTVLRSLMKQVKPADLSNSELTAMLQALKTAWDRLHPEG